MRAREDIVRALRCSATYNEAGDAAVKREWIPVAERLPEAPEVECK